MGFIFDTFVYKEYRNEAEVSQNFVLPILIQVLGYEDKEIIPEKLYPVRDMYSGVKQEKNTKELYQKPDYVICIDGKTEDPKFILDSKGSNENIDDHLNQLKSYALGVKVNFLIITNGKSLKAYNVHNLIFESENIEELDNKIDEFINIFSRETQTKYIPTQILQKIDFNISLNSDDKNKLENEKQKNKTEISDYLKYLSEIVRKYSEWQIPDNLKIFDNFPIEKIDPNKIHSFNIISEIHNLVDNKVNNFNDINEKFKNRLKIIYGDIGTGKTVLLKYLLYKTSMECLNYSRTTIPIYISLRNISNKHSIEELIKRQLSKFGFSHIDVNIYNTLKRNNFILLLDAFDEINAKYFDSTRQEIESLLDIDNIEIILTTRKNLNINIFPSDSFEIMTLNDEQVEYVVKQYLSDDYYHFLFDLETKNLLNESKNFLLLSLMIYLYREDKFIPSSINNITKKVVEKMNLWWNKKIITDNMKIEKDQIEIIISEIAYYILDNNLYNISVVDLEDKLLIKLCEELESKRKIPKGITVRQILSNIKDIGIIIEEDNEIFFWHRIFLNYYASIALLKRLNENIDFINIVKKERKWIQIIIEAITNSNNASKFIKKLSEFVWLSSNCLTESNSNDEDLIIRVILKLLEKLESPIYSVRETSLYHLRKIDISKTYQYFLKLLNESKFVDVKMVALEEISKTMNDEAIKNIYEYLDWDEGIGILGPASNNSVIKALANLNEPDYLKIIEIWRNNPDIWTDETCISIFKKVNDQNKIPLNVVDALMELYFIPESQNSLLYRKRRQLCNIFKNFPPEQYFNKLIQTLSIKNQNSFSPDQDTVDFLSYFKSKEIIEQLYKFVINHSSDELLKEGCIKSLYYSKGIVPSEYFINIINSESGIIKFYAIKGLGRFENESVNDLIIKYINSNNSNEQWAAIEASAQNGLLLDIIKNLDVLNLIHGSNIWVLIDIFKQYKIPEMIPIIDKIYNEIIMYKYDIQDYDRIFIEIAQLYCILNNEEKARKIVEKFYIDNKLNIFGFNLDHLLKIVPYFSKDFRIKLMNDYKKIIINKQHSDSYLDYKYFEVAELMDDNEIKENVKSFINEKLISSKISNEVDEFKLERPFRTLCSIGSEEDELWILDIMKEFYDSIKRHTLNRVLNCLAIFGTNKSYNLIKKIAKDHLNIPFVLNNCYYAYSRINQKSDIYSEIYGEEILN